MGEMASSYDQARKRSINPRTVRWHHNDLNEKRVRQYMGTEPVGFWDNPLGDDGDPYVVIDRHGRYHGYDGRHRGEAAMRQGRNVQARVHDERVSGPAPGSSGCVLVLLVMIAIPLVVALAVAVLA